MSASHIARLLQNGKTTRYDQEGMREPNVDEKIDVSATERLVAADDMGSIG